MTTNTDTTAASGAASRTPTDYALEFAEYLARGAEHLIEAVCADAQVRLGIAESDDVDDAAEHDAQASVDEALRSLRDRIGQFRARRDRALSAPAAHRTYSLDADPEGIRARAADAITGALAFGAQGTNRPPEGHWLTAFWEAAQAEVAARAGASAAQEAEPAGWMNPATSDVIAAALKADWLAHAGPYGANKVAPYAVPLYAHPPRPQADAGAVPAVPEGWRLLPAKATQEILDAIRRVVDLETSDPEDHRYDDGTSTADALYEALLAAAPQAPAAITAAAARGMKFSRLDEMPLSDETYQAVVSTAAAPAPAAGAAPTDAEIDDLCREISDYDDPKYFRHMVRAVLARWGAAAPAPDAPRLIGVDMAAGPDATAYWTAAAAAPTGGELEAMREAFDWEGYTDQRVAQRAFAVAVLARWGAAPAQEADGWMPIETAPRDGRVLLLGYYNAHGKWRTLCGEWVSEDQIAEYWEEEAEPGWYETSVEAEDPPNAWPTNPTHWRLPPAPPAARARQEGQA